jgi:hypothetical protein
MVGVRGYIGLQDFRHQYAPRLEGASRLGFSTSED